MSILQKFPAVFALLALGAAVFEAAPKTSLAENSAESFLEKQSPYVKNRRQRKERAPLQKQAKSQILPKIEERAAAAIMTQKNAGALNKQQANNRPANYQPEKNKNRKNKNRKNQPKNIMANSRSGSAKGDSKGGDSEGQSEGQTENKIAGQSRYAGDKSENLCLSKSRKICEYDSMTAACGDLILALRMPAPGAFLPSLNSLIERIKEEGGIITLPDRESGKMALCYSLDARELKRKKRQLEKHPAVLYGTYNFLLEKMK